MVLTDRALSEIILALPPPPIIDDDDDSPPLSPPTPSAVVVVRPRADLAANKFLFLDDDDVDIISYVLLFFNYTFLCMDGC